MIYPKRKWTEEEQNKLRELWSQDLSASLIGEQMERSRNAIIGAAHRMALPMRKGTKPERTKRVIKRTPPPVVESAPSLLPLMMNGVPLFELRPMHCRAIIGHDNSIHQLAIFCGIEKVVGSSFCSHHHTQFHEVISIRRRRIASEPRKRFGSSV